MSNATTTCSLAKPSKLPQTAMPCYALKSLSASCMTAEMPGLNLHTCTSHLRTGDRSSLDSTGLANSTNHQHREVVAAMYHGDAALAVGVIDHSLSLLKRNFTWIFWHAACSLLLSALRRCSTTRLQNCEEVAADHQILDSGGLRI